MYGAILGDMIGSPYELTEELLKDGTFLKKAIEIGNRNLNRSNMLKILSILSESRVWIPCTAVFSDEDNEAVEKVLEEAIKNDDLESDDGYGERIFIHF